MPKIVKGIADATHYSVTDSPVGELYLFADGAGVSALLWDVDADDPEHAAALGRLQRSDRHPVLRAAVRQLRDYFAGRLRKFDVPLSLHGTEFQLHAWKKLLTIPYGKTVSYQEQARRVGDVNKVRAVANANGKNPVPIIVPCHRVIGKDGSLTGFGGGLDRKRLLLDLERGERRLGFERSASKPTRARV
jgi:methylated-DNA-[protein]-cysteine S-methyltransferase